MQPDWNLRMGFELQNMAPTGLFSAIIQLSVTLGLVGDSLITQLGWAKLCRVTHSQPSDWCTSGVTSLSPSVSPAMPQPRIFQSYYGNCAGKHNQGSQCNASHIEDVLATHRELIFQISEPSPEALLKRVEPSGS